MKNEQARAKKPVFLYHVTFDLLSKKFPFPKIPGKFRVEWRWNHVSTTYHLSGNLTRKINNNNKRFKRKMRFFRYFKVKVMKSWWDMIELIKVKLFKGYDFKKWVKLTKMFFVEFKNVKSQSHLEINVKFKVTNEFGLSRICFCFFEFLKSVKN